MTDHYEIIHQLISSSAPQSENFRYLNDFAVEMGWKPSDQFSLKDTDDFASGHLVVEHGLQNSAVISFLRRNVRFSDLGSSRRKLLLNASYNNLIDWHITVDLDDVHFIYNRVDPPSFFVQRKELRRDRVSEVSSATFELLAARHPSPNVPALDDALIRTIRFWKRSFLSERPDLRNSEMSALFNGIILARAIEDHAKKSGNLIENTLWDTMQSERGNSLAKMLQQTLEAFPVQIPIELWNPESIEAFSWLEPSTILELIEDFYHNRFVRYFDYDFSIMSKHALSRIYEQYVSLFRQDQSDQSSFFPTLPDERNERSYGNVYTPEFISRFFAKYVRKEVPISKFQKMSITDPACGSGIFLRSMAEAKAESLFQSNTTRNVQGIFQSVSGIDIDANACAATRLSLSLLSLVLADQIPSVINVSNSDALTILNERPDLLSSMDVVVANPPFVKVDDLPEDRRGPLVDSLADMVQGKSDLYLGILMQGLRMLKNDGFGCFVLPKNFLLSDNAAPIRQHILKMANLRCVVDLSAVQVFEDVGVYVILIIFQMTPQPNPEIPVLIASCTDLVGLALEHTLEERVTNTPAYQVYWSTQPRESDMIWKFPPPERISLLNKLSPLPKLGDVAEVRQGLITGADKIFIVPKALVPVGERAIYVPLLADREIEPYRTPRDSKEFVIYPFAGNELLEEGTLRHKYPQTWAYLESKRAELGPRVGRATFTGPWWKPHRPREPKNLLRPKIVTPHLVITPKFAFDEAGSFAVSHTPYIWPKSPGSRDEALFLLAVLNSTPCFWFISQNAHNYSRGYSRLEVSTLKNTPIPDSAKMDPNLFREIIRLVERRLEQPKTEFAETERLLDERVAEAYELTEREKRLVGIGLFQ